MAEVLMEFERPVDGPGKAVYRARACGREMEGGGMWEGWIEFVPEGDGIVLRTARETTQPNRRDLAYWATGLSAAYFEGALQRALEPRQPVTVAPPSLPAYDGPAPRVEGHGPAPPARGVLDPFQVYEEGEDVLLKQLMALEPGHLRNIIRADDLVDEADVDLKALDRHALAELIVAAVRRRVG